jgi:hypothetical protein
VIVSPLISLLVAADAVVSGGMDSRAVARKMPSRNFVSRALNLEYLFISYVPPFIFLNASSSFYKSNSRGETAFPQQAGFIP